MTRFARAKGSKSSNLKAPDDSTPWEVMKEQMLQAKKESEDNKNRQLAEEQRIENYSNFLKEQKVQKRKSTWCDFPETENSKKVKVQITNEKSNKSKGISKNVHVGDQTDSSCKEIVQETLNSDIVNNVSNKKKKKKNKSEARELKQNIEQTKNVVANNHNESSHKKNVQGILNGDIVDNASNKKKKNKNVCSSKQGINQAENDIVDNNNTESSHKKNVQVNGDLVNNGDNVSNKKNKKKKKATELKQNIEQTSIDNKEIEGNKAVDINKKKNKDSTMDNTKTSCNSSSNVQFSKNVEATQKKKKIRGDKPTRRKEINDRSFQLIINGKEVELIRFDGFPIMKKDAERLKELKSSMMKKGIPKTEVNRTIKLERRRAEKALARLKKDVCYNCRKGGHNLSDCPELKSSIPGVGAAEGICFKCGSTEHRQFECKVQRDKEFRFASCFICKEQGHIARQCPDNPKGLYPNGGCCNLCGDVTHLRKDCPTVQNQKESTSIKLQTLDTGSNIEGIDLQTQPVPQETPRKPKKIKF